MKTKTKRDYIDLDVGGLIVASLLIVLAGILLWDTTRMTDSDSFIFPRAVIIAMVACCIVYIILQILFPSTKENPEAGLSGGSSLRRVFLALSMIVSALLMPFIGFLLSGILTFMIIMFLSMYDKWTPRLRFIFPLVGIVIVVGFYLLFAELLLVPLPIGSIFK